MINVDIITAEMRVVNGANRVTEKLLFGYDLFLKNGIELHKLYTDSYSIDCKSYTSTLGSYSNSYGFKRSVITKLKKLFLYNTRIVQSHIQNKIIKRSKKSVEKYKQEGFDADCIIFQDVFCAYYFLKDNKNNSKTILITHTDKDPLEQYLLNRPALKGSKMEKKIRDIYKYVFESVDKVISICDTAKQYLLSHYDANVVSIMNGIEDLKSTSIKFREYSFPIQVVILGSLTYRKGHDFLIDAYQQLNEEEKKKVTINIVGNGELNDKLRQEVSDKGLSHGIIFHGEIRDVEEILSKMDVMILPSRADTVPIAILEGLRSGLFVISTDKGEIPSMLSGCGMIIEASVEGVVEALRHVINNKDKLPSYSKLSREKYESCFKIESMINNYAQEINDLFIKEGK